MEEKVNLEGPAEGCKLAILLDTQYQTLGHHKSVMHHDSHPPFLRIMFVQFSNICMTERILKNQLLRKFIIFLEISPLKA